MSSKETIHQSLALSEMALSKYLDDLKPEAFLIRPVAGMNHLAWQVGHLVVVENRFVEALKPGASPALPAGFTEQYAMDKHASDSPTDFHTKDELLALFKTQRTATRHLLEGMGETDLQAPCPNEKMRTMCPTVATMFNLTGMHTLMHAGQFVAVRRHEAMPIAF